MFESWLILRRPFNEPPAAIEKLKTIGNNEVCRIQRIGLLELPARCTQIAAQHVGISLIIQNLDGFAPKPYGLRVGLVSEVKAP